MLTRRLLLATGSASFLAATASAQGGSRLREWLAVLAERHRVPGASAALIRNGEIAERLAVGVDPQTLFQAASISKVVTGMVVLRLGEQGAIGLDAPVNTMLRRWRR